MFVYSVPKNKILKLISITLVISFSIAVILYSCYSKGYFKKQETLNVSNSALNINEILKFISAYGWEVDKEPYEVREVLIPEFFDDVYNNYNEIQLKQGYDLREYAGDRVKCWTFNVRNYPGYEGKEYIKMNILICDGQVIGGDVCSVKLDGFMHGFLKE